MKNSRIFFGLWRYFKRPFGEDCLACYLRPLAFTGRFGMLCGKLNCIHTNQTGQSLKTTRKDLLFMVLYMLIPITSVAKSTYKTFFLNDPLTTKTIFIFGITGILTMCFPIIPKHLMFINNLMHIHNEFADIKNFITKDKFRKILFFYNCFFLYFILTSVIFAITIFEDKSFHFEQLFELVSFVMLGALAFDVPAFVVSIMKFYQHLLNSCFAGIKNRLYKNYSTEVVDLGFRLYKLQVFYLRVWKQFNAQFVKLYKFLLILLVLGTICFLIMFSYVSVLFWLNEMEDNFSIAFAGYSIVLVNSFVFCFFSSKLYNCNQDTVSFLFKYPISKLKPAEAAQIEMMITTFTIRKPELKVANIFTVGTRLLASISGTVVTYVLVALQFHASTFEKQRCLDQNVTLHLP